MRERARDREREKPTTPTPPSSRDLRRRRARNLAIRYALGVGLPTLLAAVYYGFVATPQYDSSAVIAIESSGDPFAVSSGKVSKDVKILRDYVQSREMTEILERETQLAQHYRDPHADFLTRLGNSDVAAYFHDKLQVQIETQTTVLKLRVRAFSAERAQAFMQAIVNAASAKVRQISVTAQTNALKPAEERLAKARAQAATSPRELEHAEEALERLHADLAQHDAFVVVVAKPSLATHPAHPKRLWGVATVFATSLALVAMLSLLAAAVREHAQF